MLSVASIAVAVAFAVAVDVAWGVTGWSGGWAGVSCLTGLGCALLGVAECRSGFLACGLELGGPLQVGEGRAALPELDEGLPEVEVGVRGHGVGGVGEPGDRLLQEGKGGGVVAGEHQSVAAGIEAARIGGQAPGAGGGDAVEVVGGAVTVVVRMSVVVEAA